MRFDSFFSGGFITAIVVNPPERKLAKRTSVHCEATIESSETGGFIFKIGYRFASNAIRYCLDGMLMLGFLNRKPPLHSDAFWSSFIRSIANSIKIKTEK